MDSPRFILLLLLHLLSHV